MSLPNSPAIILVKPQMGENIGAAARIMKNFGLSDLRIIAPRDGWPNPAAVAMAAGGGDIIENARIYRTLAEALTDIHYLLATTARPRDMVKEVVFPREAARLLHNKSEASLQTAIIFGAERSGLENEDIVLADAIVSIPVNPVYPSLNLAQSVAILSYEWKIAGGNAAPQEQALSLASRTEILHLCEHFEGELDKTAFFQVPEKRQKMVQNLRNIFMRAHLTSQETQTLRGVIRALTERR